MITVLVAQDRIHVSGHANTGPHGADIVCAAVSGMTYALMEGLREIAHVQTDTNVEPGNVSIKWQVMSDTGRALIDTWFLGICGIANEYPVIEFV